MIHIWHDIWDRYEREQLDIFDTVGDENKRTDIGNRHNSTTSLLIFIFNCFVWNSFIYMEWWL